MLQIDYFIFSMRTAENVLLRGQLATQVFSFLRRENICKQLKKPNKLWNKLFARIKSMINNLSHGVCENNLFLQIISNIKNINIFCTVFGIYALLCEYRPYEARFSSSLEFVCNLRGFPGCFALALRKLRTCTSNFCDQLHRTA